MTIQSGTDIGRYHILEKLGEGGMAVVYKAYDTRLECEVALKFIRVDRLIPENRERTLKRFEIEAKKMAQLNHSNIVKVMDYGEYAGAPYLVMPFIEGGTLKQRLGKPIPYHEAASLLIPIADALEYAHKKGLIHRDIKPSNILITESGQPMLSDFGVAKILEPEETLDLTVTGMGVGTPEYIAPEQAESKKIDQRVDIYSLGIVLYELATGRKPFEADTPMAVLIKQVRDPLPRPKDFIPELPEEVEHILLKALAKDPKDRYQNMGELAAAMEKVVNILLKESEPKLTSETQKKPSVIIEKRVAEVEADHVDLKTTKNEKTTAKPFWFGYVLIGFAALFAIFSWWLGQRSPIIPLSCLIAFTSERDGDQEIYIMDAEGSNVEQLTFNDWNDNVPSWSPDGSRIVYTSDRDGDYEVFLMDTKGSNSQQLTFNDWADFYPSWSPDSTQIVFSSDPDGDHDIYIMDTVDNKLQQLTKNYWHDSQPDWAPDGTRIALIRDRLNFEISIMDIDGNNIKQLTFNREDDFDPMWSPDCTQIIFTSNRDKDNDLEIYVINASGENEKQLTFNDWSDFDPSWSPLCK